MPECKVVHRVTKYHIFSRSRVIIPQVRCSKKFQSIYSFFALSFLRSYSSTIDKRARNQWFWFQETFLSSWGNSLALSPCDIFFASASIWSYRSSVWKLLWHPPHWNSRVITAVRKALLLHSSWSYEKITLELNISFYHLQRFHTV